MLVSGAGLRSLSRAAAKAAQARLRWFGLSDSAPGWPRRAAECERCPLRVIRDGVSYCGQPFLDQPQRDVAVNGCGCPTLAKAKDPAEHCPLDSRNRPAVMVGGGCTCKWCCPDAAG